MDHGAELQARGWVPLSARVGNLLLVPIDASLSWRLGQAFAQEPFARLEVAVRVEDALRSYVDDELVDLG
jgi:hypothetical protein